MTIKDFEVGKEVYALIEERGRTTHHTIRRYRVASVGRKYVRVALEHYPSSQIEFYKPEGSSGEYLVENKDWGNRMKLFLTEQAVNDDIELSMLKGWIRKAVEHYRLDLYTLEQLREVRRILEGKEA